jgi:nucleotide-binding universal stress UspA family protein
MLRIRTILHPTDFSEQAGFGFQMACALARDYGARLVVCHVYQPPTVVYGEFGTVPPMPTESPESLRERLAGIRPLDEDIEVQHYMLEGDPASEIIGLARDCQSDLIVMGTHGRTGLGRLFMGSVAEQVMRKAPCPVLTIKTPVAEMLAGASAAEETAER